MCYTYNTSINSFIIGVISSIILLIINNQQSKIDEKRKDYNIIAYFFLFVTLMQLYDAIFWKYKDGKVNEVTTKIAMITNHLQPIILALLIYYFKKSLKKESKYLIILYTVVITLYTLNSWNKIKYTEVTETSKPSLNWSWNHQYGEPIVYFIFLVTLIILFYQNVSYGGKLAAIISLLSFIFSLYKYQIQASTGRFWCFFSAYAPILFLINYLVKNVLSSLSFI